MRDARGYTYDEDYDLDKCVVCGVKMPNENEPTCSLECEEEREARERREKERTSKEAAAKEKENRIKEICTLLRNEENTSLLDELESLLQNKTESM